MEGLEMQGPDDSFCDSVMSQFSNSKQEHHHHICTIIGTMSQELKDQSLPLVPTAYFGATCSSLERLSLEPDPPTHIIDALTTILSLVVDRVSPSILKKKYDYLCDLIVKVLRSKSITPLGVASGLKCIKQLLIAHDKGNWADLSHLYGVLLSYITDDRPKVRRQSHMCLRDGLLNFQAVPDLLESVMAPTPVLAAASEAITSIFERFLLLAGGSNANSSEGPKGAQEVLYVLDALKECLPLMSMKSSTNILKYYKSLLELRQPLVTRRITDSLIILCRSPNAEFSSEVLLGLLCSLAASISTNETSADSLTFTARLLDVGMKKIYSLNRQICVVKLPVVFNALRDILASEHEEAVVASMEAFRSLINVCIDKGLIDQGVDQITANANVDTRTSLPTVIEKVCATIESLLDYRYAAVWDMSFQIVAIMCEKLGEKSSYLLRGTLGSLADLQKLPDEDFPYRKQHQHFWLLDGHGSAWPSNRGHIGFASCPSELVFYGVHVHQMQKHLITISFLGMQLHECVGASLGAMGPETFLSLLPLNLEAEDLSELHECVGASLGAMGPETFLSLLPLNLEAEDLSEVNVWLFPILKQYTVGAHLSFFAESILNMVELVRRKSAVLEREGKIYSARSADGLAYSLWSLFPSFCNYPLDTAYSFKKIEKVLCNALLEETEVRGIICSSLQILIQQNKRIQHKQDMSDIEISIGRQRIIEHYKNPQVVGGKNLTALSSSAQELLSVLSRIFLKSHKDDGGSLQNTIGELASISDKKVVTDLFKTTMLQLLKVTQEAVKAQTSSNKSSLSLARAKFFDLAVSLLPGLDAKEIDLLFVSIKPALKGVEGLIQKKAYKVLSSILRADNLAGLNGKNRDEFISGKLEELLDLMIEVLPSSHFSAKRHRLDCLYFLIVHISKDNSKQRRDDIISSFLTEIILALKEANKKTRNRAYDILVQIGHACGDEDKGGKKEVLHQFFNMVAGGLAGETPHMISAAVKGLARLAYEFADLISTAYDILPATFLLLQRKNREIIKANLGLLKVLVAKSPAEGLQTHLRSMLEGLLYWQDGAKNHFKAKVKLLLEMLVKKCGLDAVKAVMPEEHMKLLTNIRKIKERKERNHAANSEETRSHHSKATTTRLSRWNHTKIFSDFGEEETNSSDADFMDARTVSGRQSKVSSLFKASSLRSKRTRKVDKSLPGDVLDQLDDEPLDLLDQQKTRSVLRSSEHLKWKPESDDEPEIDSEGRLIIHEGGKKLKRERSPDPDSDGRSQASSQLSVKSRKTQKRKKALGSGWAYTGCEYTSKKAGGDVKRKDKLEPYAYWPLDRKMVSRRPEHRAAARKGMASVVKLTKKLEGKSVSNALSIKSLKFKRGKKKSR
ncbi:unnamed protein product [Ilex paraguariensis]|uniref:RRP12-like protein n=1 Tax=Ilex paraguariensis TaxID=185542 RepID=A0ABC8SPW7_9AQUA